ncbi:MAG: hypothetical protein ACTSRZ_14230 [Promethearchaeota archaeon]
MEPPAPPVQFSPFVTKVLDTLVVLSDWRKRRGDPVFVGLLLYERLRDVSDLLGAAIDWLDTGVLVLASAEEKVLRRVAVAVDNLLKFGEDVSEDLCQVRSHLERLVKILDGTAKQGLGGLRNFRDRLRRRLRAGNCGVTEANFIKMLAKFIATKGKLLFNYRRVKGAPRTNNAHELRYKQLKHFLRRVIGQTLANHFLLTHGERLVFVNPDEPEVAIEKMLRAVNFVEARALVAKERCVRESLDYIIHRAQRWRDYITELWVMLGEVSGSTISKG